MEASPFAATAGDETARVSGTYGHPTNATGDSANDGGVLAGGSIDAASAPFLGRWQRLVSTTNWEKGRIICEWRDALIASHSPVTEYSDEAWAARVGGVTGQHVGRLRRVYARFGDRSGSFSALFWSHFQAALDWEDAEMWLEGALQNDWSVSQMRQRRAETLGSLADAAMTGAADEQDADGEDFEPETAGGGVDLANSRVVSAANFDDEQTAAKHSARAGESDGEEPDEDDAPWSEDAVGPSVGLPPVQPFSNLAELPDDLQSAFEDFKLAILRHRREGWRDVRCEEVTAALAGLVELARMPLEA